MFCMDLHSVQSNCESYQSLFNTQILEFSTNLLYFSPNSPFILWLLKTECEILLLVFIRLISSGPQLHMWEYFQKYNGCIDTGMFWRMCQQFAHLNQTNDAQSRGIALKWTLDLLHLGSLSVLRGICIKSFRFHRLAWHRVGLARATQHRAMRWYWAAHDSDIPSCILCCCCCSVSVPAPRACPSADGPLLFINTI